MAELLVETNPKAIPAATLANFTAEPPELEPDKTEKRIPIKRGWYFGRTISFSYGQNCIEMATVSFGLRGLRLIDCQKQYLLKLENEEKLFDQLSLAIAEYLRQYANRYTRICVCLTGGRTAYRTFLMPRMTASQLTSAIIYEIRKQLPFPVNDCHYDYRQVATLERNGQTFTKIALSAATKEVTEKALTPIERAGYPISFAYNAPEAVGQLLRYLPDFHHDRTYAMIWIGSQQTALCYFRGTELIFYNYSGLGSSIISGRSDVQRFDDFAQLMAAEVQNSLDYYAAQLSTGFDNQIYIHGDLAYSDELIQQMKSHLGFAFHRFPAEKLTFLSDEQKPSMSSLSASVNALAAAVTQYRIANLLPAEQIEKNTKRTTHRLALAGLMLLVLLLSGLGLGQYFSMKDLQVNLNSANQTLEQFKASDIAAKLNQVKADIVTRQQYLKTTVKQNAHVGLYLKELSLITPKEIRLNTLEADRRDATKPVWRFTGTAYSNGEPNELILATYVERLKQSPLFTDVQVERYRKRPTESGFELDFDIVAGSPL